MQEQDSLGTGTGLGEQLRRHHAEGEPGVDDVVGQALRGQPAALEHRVEADLLRAPDALVEIVERPAFVEVGDVHHAPRGAELVGERPHPVRQPLRVMEEQHLGHPATLGLTGVAEPEDGVVDGDVVALVHVRPDAAGPPPRRRPTVVESSFRDLLGGEEPLRLRRSVRARGDVAEVVADDEQRPAGRDRRRQPGEQPLAAAPAAGA